MNTQVKILQRVCAHFHTQPERILGVVKPISADERITRAILYMITQTAMNALWKDVAESYGVTPSYISKEIKWINTFLHSTPMAEINKFRLDTTMQIIGEQHAV